MKYNFSLVSSTKVTAQYQILLVTCKVTKASFLWRRVVPEKRVTLRDNFLKRSYMREKLKPLPRPTALAQSLIVSP